jgi:glucose-1-phosphate thymidylyltransferase
MRAIILAGGYAKRLWPLTKNTPKPLLPIGDYYIIDYIVSKVRQVEGLEEIIISTNKRFEANFQGWIKERGLMNVRVSPEPSLKEEEKLGPTKALELILKGSPRDDYLIAAGDNLFSLDLRDMVAFFRQVKAPVVALYEIGSSELAKKYACVELGSACRIMGFEEKPESPKSLLVSTGIYTLPLRSISRIGEYLKRGNPPDPIGRFIGWLAERDGAYGFKFSGYWYDIGSLESYQSAKDDFAKRGILP